MRNINERGHSRYITSNIMRDKTVNHLLCDEVITPSIQKYLAYTNSASQKGKGVRLILTRTQIEAPKRRTTSWATARW